LQITKHVAKINGEQSFIGLLTFSNGKGKIQGANWLSTKARSRFELGLASTRHSLNLFNHRQSEAAYTDNSQQTIPRIDFPFTLCGCYSSSRIMPTLSHCRSYQT
jgi:hypothetical protein